MRPSTVSDSHNLDGECDLNFNSNESIGDENEPVIA